MNVCKALGDSARLKARALCQLILNDPSLVGSLCVLITSCLRHLLQKAFPGYQECLYHSVLRGHHPSSVLLVCLLLVSHSRMDCVEDESGVFAPWCLSYLRECWAPDRSSESIHCVTGPIRKAVPSRQQGTGDGSVESRQGTVLNSATESGWDLPGF